MLFRTAAGGGGVGHNQSGKSDQHVDDAGQNAHAAKQEGNQIEVEKSDQAPVEGADNGQNQRGFS